MNNVEIRSKDGSSVCYLFEFKEKDILKKDDLERLKPFINSFIDADASLAKAKGRLKIEVLSETQASFKVNGRVKASNAELLSKIREVCTKNLTEKLIVTQVMGPNGADLRHRVLVFELQKRRMVVKFAQLSNKNNFDTAMTEIERLYPLK